ncbi:hypothetical protein HZA39_02825 [Candidatus Peregrinibacteria bacterium]|nr:hypothetical protein [Candidatus Peregrinibacteria bacterium]
MADEPSKSETNPEEKIIPAKKILYAELDDEVTTVFDRVQSTKIDDIYIVVPKQAVLFQSLVNLKILKKKVEDLGKKMSVITNDQSGIRLCGQIGISVYNRIDQKGLPILAQWKAHDDKEIKISPLKAAINTIEDETPTRLKSRKLSISEMLQRGKKSSDSILPRGFNIFKRKKTEDVLAPMKETINRKLVLIAPNKQALIALVTISVLVLVIIAYIALPGVTISITPKASVLEQSTNITLADLEKNKAELETHLPQVLSMTPIAITVKKTVQFSATGKLFKGENSHGTLVIYNLFPDERPLIPRTRFQTQEGLVFRIQSYVTVPASRGNVPGKIEVYVLADEFDAYGNAIGERGNISPSKFFLPALSGETQKKIYAESFALMAGGKTVLTKKITKEDLKTSAANMKAVLRNSALDELAKIVAEKNIGLAENMRFELVNNKFAIEASEPRVVVDNGLEGRTQDQFEAYGEIDLRGYYFNKAEVIEILKSEVILKKSPQKLIAKVDENSFSYRVFDVDMKTGHIKITAMLKALEEFDLNPEKEMGAQLVKKIKDHITGKKIQDAKDYIRNLAEVEKVEIKSWPAWAPTIPSVPDNIKVEIVR